MSFGNKLKILRACHGMCQETVSKKLNISQPVYSRYENDEKEVNEYSPVVKKVAEEFHVSANWLLEGDAGHLLPGTELILNDAGSVKEQDNIPENFMAVLLKQQKMTEQILQLLTAK